jgi:hypothetical protein
MDAIVILIANGSRVQAQSLTLVVRPSSTILTLALMLLSQLCLP